ncbi:MAG: electron transport complex protein RnfC, partial [Clostridiales bacterium]|nr:electron transport complex protein RnfC [Clostridiales bacterium]
CPAGLYPRAANVYFKDRLAQQHVQYVRNQDKFEPRGAREYRMLPTKRLIMRLGLKKFDKPAPITEIGAEPAQVCISTKQHLGAPASPVVSPGERVLAGQKIGEVPKGSLGAAIHASITGVVAEVSGECITIRRD